MTRTRQDLEQRISTLLQRPQLEPQIGEFFETSYRELQRLLNFKCMEVTFKVAYVASQSAYALSAFTKLVGAGDATSLKKPLLAYKFDTVKNGPSHFYDITSIEMIRKKRYDDYQASVVITQEMINKWLLAIFANNVELWPNVGTTDITGFELRIDAYQYLTPPKTDDSDWFLNNAWDYLLYSSLLQSEPFIHNDARIQLWTGLASKAFDSLMRPEIDEQWSGELVMRG